MKPPNYDLSIGISGDGVSLLHKELILLGYKIADSEVKKEFFGKFTQTAVKRFQSDHHLEVTGNLNRSTFALLHKLTANKDSKSNDDSNKNRKKVITKNKEVQNENIPKTLPITNGEASILLKPKILFGNLKNSELENGESSFIVEKLNDQFHNKVLEEMGKVSDAMHESLKIYVNKLDYRKPASAQERSTTS
jgi:peptidoglycan hydrolase-like protein with peptidoglycan-binding domain